MDAKIQFIELTDRNFREEILERRTPMIVKFYAPSTIPFISILPILENVLTDYKGSVEVGRFNVEQNSQVSALYRIRELPTLLFFRNGIVVDYLIGIFRSKELRVCLENLLGKGSEV